MPPRKSLTNLFQEINLSSYAYAPLDSEGSEIRLLTLHPSTDHSDKPKISIQTTTLTSDHVPHYEALSYSWGKHHNLENILVIEDGEKAGESSTHQVTYNLAEALRYLRYEKEDRTLWIDAICINQSNLIERSKQVVRMGEIYTKAQRVIAWLGPSEGDENSGTKAGMRAMKEFADKLRVNWATGDIHPFGDDPTWGNIQVQLPFDVKTYLDIKSVIDKPWFTRLWIWQEIRLGGPTSMIVCGRDNMLWGDFRKAVFCISFKKRKAEMGNELERFYRRLRLVYPLISVTNEGTNSLERLLEETQQCEYADPRDRIFSIISLLNYGGRQIGLTADYTQPVHKVYQDVVVRFIKGTGTVNILNHCEMPEGEGLRNKELPSWVPDWENMKNPPREAFVWQHASGYSTSSTELPNDKILAASGVKVGVIDTVDSTDLASTMQSELVDIIRRLAPPDVLEGKYAGGGSLIDAFCRSTFWGVTSDRFIPPLNVVDDYAEFKEAIVEVFASPEKSYPQPSWTLKNFYTYNMRYAYFTTKEGYLGYAPKAAKSGDVLVVLRGLDVVMALRPVGSRFQLVGACYVHQFMNSEALLGPLPKQFEAVLLFDKGSSQYWRYFQNRETGELQAEDPRLGPLPAGWVKRAHTLDHIWTWFWNEQTGEDGETRDPRFTTDELLKRGVKLETFELV